MKKLLDDFIEFMSRPRDEGEMIAFCLCLMMILFLLGKIFG
jgi:hypothetical protein